MSRAGLLLAWAICAAGSLLYPGAGSAAGAQFNIVVSEGADQGLGNGGPESRWLPGAVEGADVGAAITGTVMAGDTGIGVSAGVVRVYGPEGGLLGSALIRSDGTYRYAGLAPGVYYVRTHATGYLDQLWLGVACPQGLCRVNAGTPVRLFGAEARADFRLDPGSVIAGVVWNEGTDEPVTTGSVRIFDAMGNWVGSAPIGEDGEFWYGGLLSGTYYLRTHATGFADRWWRDDRHAGVGANTDARSAIGVGVYGSTHLYFRIAQAGR